MIRFGFYWWAIQGCPRNSRAGFGAKRQAPSEPRGENAFPLSLLSLFSLVPADALTAPRCSHRFSTNKKAPIRTLFCWWSGSNLKRIFANYINMTHAKKNGKEYQRNTCQHNTAKQEYARRNYRKRQRF